MCCRINIFDVSGFDKERYELLKLRKNVICTFEEGISRYCVVDMPCKHLLEDGRCELKGSDERPKICDRYPEVYSPVLQQLLPMCSYRWVSDDD